MARIGPGRDRRHSAAFALGGVLTPLLVLVAMTRPASAADEPTARLAVVADKDDDDVDGVPDGASLFVRPTARVDLIPLGREWVGSVLLPTAGGEHARLVVAGRPLAWGVRVPTGTLVQGLSAGVASLRATRNGQARQLDVTVVELGFRDGRGDDVDLARSHASLDREPPSEVQSDPEAPFDGVDPLRVRVVTAEPGPPPLAVESVGPTGVHLDALPELRLSAVPCATRNGLHCFASEPLRFVIDEVDRRHALARDRSVRAELGGAIVLTIAGRKQQAIRVLGPRSGPAGPIGRLRGTIRPFVVRLAPGGVPAIGGNEAGAIAALRAELTAASAVWSECGVTFGPEIEENVRVVDPPPAHLLAIGNDLGLPAAGGTIDFRVDGTHVIEVSTRPGQQPLEVARDAARALEHAGFTARLSVNARVASAADASVDVSVRHRDGSLARLERIDLGTPVSTDPSLTVRIGSVDLADGLTHFGDTDSVAGTLEERTLLKAYDDGDPTTIEVMVVPFFSGGGRIGESFIGTDHSSLRNVVLIDRAGVRARRSSFTLAHELGHVLLDVPGHPDDYGVDTPTRLMDADASDASPFGPRRLTLTECARVVHESGPTARTPLLREWPLAPIDYARPLASSPSSVGRAPSPRSR